VNSAYPSTDCWIDRLAFSLLTLQYVQFTDGTQFTAVTRTVVPLIGKFAGEMHTWLLALPVTRLSRLPVAVGHEQQLLSVSVGWHESPDKSRVASRVNALTSRPEHLFVTRTIASNAARRCLWNYCKKLNSLKHLVRKTVAESHNKTSKYEKGAITCQHIVYTVVLTRCFKLLSFLQYHTLARECCKGDDESQWERGKFDPRHPKFV